MRNLESKNYKLIVDKNMGVFCLRDKETTYQTPWYTGEESKGVYKTMAAAFRNISRIKFDELMRNEIYGIDNRYKVLRVWGGQKEQVYEAFFCDELLGAYYIKIAALGKCREHNQDRKEGF